MYVYLIIAFQIIILGLLVRSLVKSNPIHRSVLLGDVPRTEEEHAAYRRQFLSKIVGTPEYNRRHGITETTK